MRKKKFYVPPQGGGDEPSGAHDGRCAMGKVREPGRYPGEKGAS